MRTIMSNLSIVFPHKCLSIDRGRDPKGAEIKMTGSFILGMSPKVSLIRNIEINHDVAGLAGRAGSAVGPMATARATERL